MFGVILAGGSGSRLWPLSRELYPKQLLNLCAEKSLLQSTFERLNKFIPAENITAINSLAVGIKYTEYEVKSKTLSEFDTEAREE